jgi:tetratricopeptide (TPR) repeat protein
MTAAWHQGRRPQAEEFLARHPALSATPPAAVQLVYEEICLREEAGQKDAAQEVTGRFPQWRAELEVLLDCHRLLQQPALAGPVFPDVGATLGDLRLVRELGRGAKGRVFLAVQPSLAGRPVVVKVTPCDGQEHLALAQLQHTFIVPLYQLQDFPDRRLRALCMPYLGGATLAQLLAALRGQPPAEWSGAALLRELERVGNAAPVRLPSRTPAREFFRGASHVEAACIIGECLADALQHAHERKLLHLDVKPSNVLLAADGTPMLLDFHLARPPLRRGDPVPDWFGGTPDYMSPEQRLALEAVRQRQRLPQDVGPRSDVYALGLVLHEALGGTLPAGGAAPAPLHHHNPEVSAGLSDLVRRCLAPVPAERYPSAGDVAADLRRHREGRPLRGVREPWDERWQKWRRRKPYALRVALLGTLAAACLLGTGVSGVRFLRDRLHTAEAALADGRLQIARGHYEEAEQTLEHGLEAVGELPVGRGLAPQLAMEVCHARRARFAHDLHALADRARFRYDGTSLPDEVARPLLASCRQVWDRRNLALDAWADPGPAGEEQVRTDLLDLALFWADLRARVGEQEPDPAEARREILGVLAEAEEAFGASPAVARQRQACAAALGDRATAAAAARQAERLVPRTAWEHHALGRSLLASGQPARAAEEFARALDLEPDGFWPRFDQGRCLYRLARYRDAAEAFRVCTALAPACAECFYNLALAEAADGRTEVAVKDYDQALARNPTLTEAAQNRDALLRPKK